MKPKLTVGKTKREQRNEEIEAKIANWTNKKMAKMGQAMDQVKGTTDDTTANDITLDDVFEQNLLIIEMLKNMRDSSW